MSDWYRGTIGELAKGYRGVTYAAGQLCAFKSPDTTTLLRSNNISSGRLNFEDVQIVPSRLVSGNQLLRPGDIAVCMSNGSKALVGKAAPFLGSRDERFTVGAFCSVFRPTDASASAFISFVFQSKEYRKNLDLALAGSAINNLRNADLEAFGCDIPPPNEQQKIAEVLDTLDTAIHETEAIIAKLKAVKQGLLHDLLTRGIDANGELRPSQAEAPHLYKESPLGWIPKEWACRPFGELCESSAFGPRFPSDAYDENGPLATLRTTDMDDEGNISLSTMPRAAIKPSVFADHLLRPGDIVISRSGTCGVTGVFTGHDIPVVPGAFLIRFRLRDLRLNRFYRRYFNASLGRPYLERLAVGGVQKNIKGSDVLCLQVPNPEPTEAVAIGDRIESVEHDIESNQQLLRKLQLQKSGLMDDLLTGRVRVTPLLANHAIEGNT